MALLACAVSVAEQEPPTLLAGDTLDLLPEALAAGPEGASPCVFHTFTLNQISGEGARYTPGLDRVARGRRQPPTPPLPLCGRSRGRSPARPLRRSRRVDGVAGLVRPTVYRPVLSTPRNGLRSTWSIRTDAVTMSQLWVGDLELAGALRSRRIEPLDQG